MSCNYKRKKGVLFLESTPFYSMKATSLKRIIDVVCRAENAPLEFYQNTSKVLTNTSKCAKIKRIKRLWTQKS